MSRVCFFCEKKAAKTILVTEEGVPHVEGEPETGFVHAHSECARFEREFWGHEAPLMVSAIERVVQERI